MGDFDSGVSTVESKFQETPGSRSSSLVAGGAAQILYSNGRNSDTGRWACQEKYSEL